MVRRYLNFGFIIGWLSATTMACAVSPARTASEKPRRAQAVTPARMSSPVPATASRSSSRAAPAPAGRPTSIVVIDAGHGGHDRGGIPGQRVPEKVMTLDVAQRLRTILNANGYRTIMTRDSDVFVPLPRRIAIANAYSNSIFVCIHFNSARRRGANGVETYFYSSQSWPLASAIHYYVAKATPTSDRGVRRRGYYVLRKTTVPSVLVECGFLTNPNEAQYAQSTRYRQMLAEEIARGIRSRTSTPTASGTQYASSEAVPLQPFIDLTRVRDRDISGHKRRARKISKSKKATAVRKKSSSARTSGSSANRNGG